MPEQPNIPELDALIAALWRAVAKTLAQPIAQPRTHAIAAAEAVERQLRLASELFVKAVQAGRICTEDARG